jgi:hypothetical protein
MGFRYPRLSLKMWFGVLRSELKFLCRRLGRWGLVEHLFHLLEVLKNLVHHFFRGTVF